MIKLNLGCSDDIKEGFINVDIFPGKGVDVVTDLNALWPWGTNTVSLIIANDIIEHLHNKIQTMNEIWRVLAPRGRVLIVVPTTNGSGAFQDPTHVSYWNERSFLYYEDGNIYRERFAAAYGITARFKVIGKNLDQTEDGEKLTILLEAVK